MSSRHAAAVATFGLAVADLWVLSNQPLLAPYVALLAVALGVAGLVSAVALWQRGCLESRCAAGFLALVTLLGVGLHEAIGLPGLDAGRWSLQPLLLLGVAAAALGLSLTAHQRADLYAS